MTSPQGHRQEGGNSPPATSFYGPTVTQSSTSMPRQPEGRDLREKQPGVRDVHTSGKAPCAFHLAFLLHVILEKGLARDCRFLEKDCKGAHMSLREITREAARAAFGSSPSLALQRGGRALSDQPPEWIVIREYVDRSR